MTNKKICFDMDGTIADLYNVENWKELLEAESVIPYIMAKPMWDMEALRSVCHKLMAQGWAIEVITWLSANSSKHYENEATSAKYNWIATHGLPVNRIHALTYGTDKESCLDTNRITEAILIDDNAEVRSNWKLGSTINPENTNVIEALTALLI